MRLTSNLAILAEPLPFHYETLDVLVDGASASPGGNGQYSRNEPLSPDLRQPDCRHTRAALCHFDLNLSVSRLRRARLVNWLCVRSLLRRGRRNRFQHGLAPPSGNISTRRRMGPESYTPRGLPHYSPIHER